MNLPKFHILDSTITAQRDGQTFDLFVGIMAQGKSQVELAVIAGQVHGALLQLGHNPQFKFSPDESKGGAV